MTRPMSKLEQRATHVVGKTLGGLHTRLYRMSGGRIGSHFVHGAPVMLLTTRGRKTGLSRTIPLLFLRDGEKLVAVASKAGYPSHPYWYLNLQAEPEVSVQIGSEARTMRAQTATAEQKARYWPRLCAIYPPYQHYQDRTDREIPVVIFRPV
jgi:deazaflavin-dependent oxidoreductase (nitroreductase family)